MMHATCVRTYRWPWLGSILCIASDPDRTLARPVSTNHMGGAVYIELRVLQARTGTLDIVIYSYNFFA